MLLCNSTPSWRNVEIVLSPLKGVASSNLLLQLTHPVSPCVSVECRQGCNLVPIAEVTPLFQTPTPDNAGIKELDVSSMLTAEDKQQEPPAYSTTHPNAHKGWPTIPYHCSSIRQAFYA